MAFRISHVLIALLLAVGLALPVVTPAEAAVANPAIAVTKSASPTTVSTPCDVTYSYTVTNTGDVLLDPVTLVDDLAGPVTLTASSLAPGASTTGTASFSITQAMIDAGTPIVNTAIATGIWPLWPEFPVTATATATVTISNPPPPPPPGISITKQASKKSVAPYDRVTYTYVVTNTGGVPLTNITVTDDGGTPGFTGDDFVVGTVASLAPGASATFTATVILPLKMCMVVNNHNVDVGQLIVQMLTGGNVKVVYIQSRNVVDNTYGKNAVGYIKNHNFKDLIGSDCADFRFTDSSGTVVLDFLADYVHNTSLYPSGYGTLGVKGGDGKMVKGSASNILSIMTSITENLNQSPAFYGYIVNSPPEPNPNWNYFDSYTVVVDGATFGTKGLGKVTIPYVHDSPSKLGVNKIIPQPCDSTVTNTAVVTASANGQTVTATAQETVNILASNPCS